MPNNMSIDELVAVNSLLIERETCLADLSHIETTISDILGQEYPFELPAVTLPSTQKGKRVKGPKKTKAKAAPKIRRLKEPEIAYRVVLQEHGKTLTHDVLDFSPFQDLIAAPLPNHRIHSVVTLGPTIEVVESLFESE